MDDYQTIALKILSSYSEFTNVEQDGIGVIFSYNDADYKIWIFTEDKASMPIITTINNTKSFPHITLFDTEVSGKKYRELCLFEQGTIVNALLTFEEKIVLLADRLIELATLSKHKIEREYQKEFLYYWNIAVKNTDRKYLLFVNNDSQCLWLDQCIYKNNVIRIKEPTIKFNDESDMIYKDKIPVLFLPILDTRNILPPLPDKPWGASNILDIICNDQFNRIDFDMYKEVVDMSYARQTIILIFKLEKIYFGCILKFKNAGTAKLIKKLEKDICEVIPIKIERCDYSYLNQQIGNDLSLINKKIAIVGAGSLGSYFTAELIRAGCKSIVLIDDDKLEPPNVMRHRLPLSFSGISKSIFLAFDAMRVHPEIFVEYVNKRIDSRNCVEIFPVDVDVVLFTVGNSDVQIRCNMQYKNANFNKPVLFAWLEGDGYSSHVLAISYNFKGCFECLFTDVYGNLVNNQANISNDLEIPILRNGCGGTRVAYGNSTLLTATAITLQALKDIINNEFKQNFLINYTNSTITKEYTFMKESCGCCGGDK